MGVILDWIGISVLAILEGKVVVGLAEGSECSVILFLRLRGISTR